jgi:L-lysine exporter family protein LysE/ArgO
MLEQWHVFVFGLALGLGAAMPLGPVNFEIMRRNLRFGTASGLLLGLGAACTDLTYLAILSAGAISLLTHQTLLATVGIIGSFILFWFGFTAFKSQPKNEQDSQKSRPKALYRHWLEGYLMTLLNPITILFWASVSTQVALQSHRHDGLALWMGGGVIFGAYGWAIAVNLVLHHTRHKINEPALAWINKIGALILIAFAAFGLIRAVIPLLN